MNAEKEALIREVLAQEMLSPGETCMIGDRSFDVAGARANGIEAVAVLWGYGSPEELNAAGPDRMVASMRELCEHVDGRP